MRKLVFLGLLIVTITTSCDFMFRKTIHGNGNLKSEERTVTNTDKIKSLGNFNVDIVQGSPSSLKIEADENLLPYIITENKDDKLVIRAREGYNLSSDNKIKVTVTTGRLADIEVDGSGDVNGEGKFTG